MSRGPLRRPPASAPAGRKGDAVPAWLAPSPKLPPRDPARYGAVATALQEIAARPRDRSAEAALRVAAAAMLLDLAVEAARRGIPWKRFSDAVMEGEAAAPFGAADAAAFHAELLGAPPGGPALYAALDEAASARKADWACGAGCWMCCAINTRVTALPAEVRAAWAALRDRPVPAAPHPRACPALGADGLCMVYEVRPAVCARLGSTDLAACRAALDRLDAGEETLPFMQPAPSPRDPWALTQLLAEVAGEPKRHVDLVAALRRLREGASMAQALAAGRASHLAANPGERNRLDPPAPRA